MTDPAQLQLPRLGSTSTRSRHALLCGALVPLAALLLIGCKDSGTTPDAGPDIDALFAPPQPSEIAAVEAEWATRNPVPGDVTVELDSIIDLGLVAARLRVLSHTVPGGGRHYGALLTPEPAPIEALPVVVYAHGGDGGTSIDELLLLAAVLRTEGVEVAFVAPSFRAESLRIGGRVFLSEGAASPWDRDVDDAMALLSAALGEAPELDAERIGLAGLSRGGGVGLLMGARDPRLDAVVSFFGPTDFFGEYVRDIVEEALRGIFRNLPGLDELNDAVIEPWSAGTLSTADARLEMIRRSAVYFVDRLPPVQIHHGTADFVVAVSQAERLIEAMEDAGRTSPDFEAYIYPGGGHNAFTLLGGAERAAEFFADFLTEPQLVAGGFGRDPPPM